MKVRAATRVEQWRPLTRARVFDRWLYLPNTRTNTRIPGPSGSRQRVLLRDDEREIISANYFFPCFCRQRQQQQSRLRRVEQEAPFARVFGRVFLPVTGKKNLGEGAEQDGRRGRGIYRVAERTEVTDANYQNRPMKNMSTLEYRPHLRS